MTIPIPANINLRDGSEAVTGVPGSLSPSPVSSRSSCWVLPRQTRKAAATRAVMAATSRATHQALGIHMTARHSRAVSIGVSRGFASTIS
jgi:hypothetical protein